MTHRTAVGEKVFTPEMKAEVEPFMAARRAEGYKAIARDKWRVVNGRGFYVTTVFWYVWEEEPERQRA